ncbi:MAG: phenylalanine--tRNA ligase subunit beta, partial [bacterium]
LAFVVDIETPGGKLFEKIQEWGGTNLKDIFIFDVYSGQQVPIGKKSIAFSLTFQANERTLTEDEVNEAVDQIIRAARNEFDAVLRG